MSEKVPHWSLEARDAIALTQAVVKELTSSALSEIKVYVGTKAGMTLTVEAKK